MICSWNKKNRTEYVITDQKVVDNDGLDAALFSLLDKDVSSNI